MALKLYIETFIVPKIEIISPNRSTATGKNIMLRFSIVEIEVVPIDAATLDI